MFALNILSHLSAQLSPARNIIDNPEEFSFFFVNFYVCLFYYFVRIPSPMLAVALNTQAVPDVLLSPVLNTQAVSVLLSPVLSPHVRLRSALASTLVSRMTSRRSPTWCPPWPRFSTSSRTRTSLLYLIWSIRWLSFPTSGVAWWGHFYLFTSQNEPTFSSFNFIKPKQLHQLNCLFFSSFIQS